MLCVCVCVLQLYKVVEARRGATEIKPNSNAQLDITLLPVNNPSGYPKNDYHGGNVNHVPVQHKTFKHLSNYTNDTCSYGVNSQNNGFAGPQSYTANSQDVMLDILDGYLGMESESLSQSREKPHGAPNPVSVQNFYSTIMLSSSVFRLVIYPFSLCLSERHPESECLH